MSMRSEATGKLRPFVIMLWRLAASVAGISAAGVAATVWWRERPSPSTTFRCGTTKMQNSETSPLCNQPESKHIHKKTSLLSSIEESRALLKRTMTEQGIPGAVICVSVDGHEVWNEGLGYADLENDVACSPHTVMRIASISKCLCAVAAMQLWEDGLLDLDASVHSYVPEFPSKMYEGTEVEITSRQLLCHTGGIRHYKKATELENEFKSYEYFVKDHYNSVFDSLELFYEDDLVYAPGTKFHYTTHGWTLLSAVIERVSGQPFLDYLHSHIISPLGMDSTGPEQHEPFTYNRARYYNRNSSGKLQNSPYVDISYKWAGGGLVSSAPDLCRFGSALLLCYQSGTNSSATSLRKVLEKNKTSNPIFVSSSSKNNVVDSPLLLQPETVSTMWREVVSNVSSKSELGYALGWMIQRGGERVQGGKMVHYCVGHTGGTVGASSVLLILPNLRTCGKMVENGVGRNDVRNRIELNVGPDVKKEVSEPRGVVVAIICNLQQVQGFFSLGSQIASIFYHHSEHGTP